VIFVAATSSQYPLHVVVEALAALPPRNDKPRVERWIKGPEDPEEAVGREALWRLACAGTLL